MVTMCEVHLFYSSLPNGLQQNIKIAVKAFLKAYEWLNVYIFDYMVILYIG